jgi:hypothetical protein
MIRPVEASTSARRAALAGLIDHAALFPPASMSMADALAEDARVRAGPTGWIVNRFIVPASRIAELGDERLPLSVVRDTPAELDDPRVEAVEVPAGSAAEVDPQASEIYAEIPGDADVEAWLGSIRATGLRAKVRCGGAVVPSVERLAAFVRLCRELGLVFKATAGLHRPIRHDGEHGFLNLLAAAVFGDEETVLAEEDAGAFGLDDQAFRWRDRSADADEIGRIRRELFVGFGSCSVQEPVDELLGLGILPG